MIYDPIDIALTLAKIALIFLVILTLAAYLVLAERKVLAWIQDRKGPNRVGPFGLLQPLADLIKLLTKEDFRPIGADKWLFYLAPAMAAIPAIMIFAVIPFGAPLTLFGHTVPLQVADLNVGLLLFMALSSIAVYGVALGGWASNSKYALLGSIRGLAQLISYELSMGLSLVPVVMLARSFRLSDIVNAQTGLLVHRLSAAGLRDLPDQYRRRMQTDPLRSPRGRGGAGGRFSHRVLRDAFRPVLRRGIHQHHRARRTGGHLFPRRLARPAGCRRWSGFHARCWPLPSSLSGCAAPCRRLRYDQLMHFGWKVLTPLALVNILVTGWFLVLRG